MFGQALSSWSQTFHILFFAELASRVLVIQKNAFHQNLWESLLHIQSWWVTLLPKGLEITIFFALYIINCRLLIECMGALRKMFMNLLWFWINEPRRICFRQIFYRLVLCVIGIGNLEVCCWRTNSVCLSSRKDT